MIPSKRNMLVSLTAAMLVGTTFTAPAAAQGAVMHIASARAYADGAYAGPVYNAYYGYVQVRANIRNGRLNSIDILQYPNDRRTSRYINSQALPILETEVIQAQSARVNMVSGATLTSNAFLHSLAGALVKARG